MNDLAHQAGDDAVVAILRRLPDFRGESRFTTGAYKFAILEVSSKLGRHFWTRRTDVTLDGEQWNQLPMRLGVTPDVFAAPVVLINPGSDPGAGLHLGGEALETTQLESQRRVPRLDHRVVQGRPDPAIDWVKPIRLQAARKIVAVYSTRKTEQVKSLERETPGPVGRTICLQCTPRWWGVSRPRDWAFRSVVAAR